MPVIGDPAQPTVNIQMPVPTPVQPRPKQPKASQPAPPLQLAPAPRPQPVARAFILPWIPAPKQRMARQRPRKYSSPEILAFHNYMAENRNDTLVHNAYADWLDENDKPHHAEVLRSNLGKGGVPTFILSNYTALSGAGRELGLGEFGFFRDNMRGSPAISLIQKHPGNTEKGLWWVKSFDTHDERAAFAKGLIAEGARHLVAEDSNTGASSGDLHQFRRQMARGSVRRLAKTPQLSSSPGLGEPIEGPITLHAPEHLRGKNSHEESLAAKAYAQSLQSNQPVTLDYQSDPMGQFMSLPPLMATARPDGKVAVWKRGMRSTEINPEYTNHVLRTLGTGSVATDQSVFHFQTDPEFKDLVQGLLKGEHGGDLPRNNFTLYSGPSEKGPKWTPYHHGVALDWIADRYPYADHHLRGTIEKSPDLAYMIRILTMWNNRGMLAPKRFKATPQPTQTWTPKYLDTAVDPDSGYFQHQTGQKIMGAGGGSFEPAPGTSHLAGWKLTGGGFVKKFYAPAVGAGGATTVLSVSFKGKKGNSIYEWYFDDEKEANSYLRKLRGAQHPGRIIKQLESAGVGYKKIYRRFGAARYREEVPPDVLAFLASLPDSERRLY